MCFEPEAPHRLVDSLYVARLPASADRGLRRGVETQDRKEPTTRNGGKPVALRGFRCLGAEVQRGAPVGFLRGLVELAERGERLAVVEARGVLGFVQRDRPEEFRRDVGRQLQLVAAGADQWPAFTVVEGDHVEGAL